MKKKNDLAKTDEDYRWIKTHEKLNRAISEFVLEHERFPTHDEIKEETKLGRATIYAHMQKIRIGEYLPELRAATPEIVKKLSETALKGDVKAIRLWLQYVEGWRPNDPGAEATNADVEINIGFDDAEN